MSQQSEPQTTTTPVTITENVEQTKQFTRDELKESICKQVEYYFSRQNLSTDHYLVSQMSHDLFVPVSVIANFKMIKTLTNDLDLICEAVKNSNQVILDAANKKLKPNIVLKRNTVIIRDILQNTPKEEILKLFSPDNQPVNIHSDIGNTWFTSFETEEKTIEAVQHLKTQQWDEKPIQARIKTESLLKTVGTTPTQTPQQTLQNNGYQYSYNNRTGGNRKFNNNNNNNRTNQNNGSQQPKERNFNNKQQQQQTSPASATTAPQSQNGNRNNNNNSSSSSSRGASQRGGRTRSNSGSRSNQASTSNATTSNSGSSSSNNNGNGSSSSKPSRPRKDMLNLNSTKSFPPLPKMNETEQVGYGNQKFLRYSKQTVMSVYMEQQERGEHSTRPEILNGNECIAILKEPKKDLELHKPQMDKSQLANHTLPIETEGVSSVQSVKPTNLLIPKSSFAEAAITAKDIKTPDTPSTTHFFAKSRKRRGSNAPAQTLTHQKPHYSKPQKSETKETKEKSNKASVTSSITTSTTTSATTTATTNITTTELAPSINVTSATPAATSSTDQPVSWVSVVASKK